MMKMLLKLIPTILLRSQKDSDLALENLAFRQQLSILKRHKKRPQIRTKDRLFWIMLCRFWSNWQPPLIVVKPETVIRWHRKGFNRFFHGSNSEILDPVCACRAQPSPTENHLFQRDHQPYGQVDDATNSKCISMGHGAKVSAEGPGLDLRIVFQSTY
jgi:hypothetical protein